MSTTLKLVKHIPQPSERLAVVGDSLSSTAFGTNGWVEQLISILATDGFASVTRFAVPGETILQQSISYPTGAGLVSPNAIGGASTLMTLCGTNDHVSGQTGATIYSRLQTLWGLGKADGYKVVAFTIPPIGTITATTFISYRLDANRLIRAAASLGEYDVLVDLADAFQDPFDTSFFDVDRVHFNQAGFRKVAELVISALSVPFASTPAQLNLLATVGSIRRHPTGQVLTTGIDNFTDGIGAGALISTGTLNFIQGVGAGASVTTGSRNLIVGPYSATLLATFSDSTHVGYRAGQSSTNGSNCTFGSNAGYRMTGGAENVYVGYNAGSAAANGAFFSTSVGARSLLLANGNGNTAVGCGSGASITTGTVNTFLGLGAGDNASQLATATNSTAIGNGSFTTASNQVVIGNPSVTQTVIRGFTGALAMATLAPASTIASADTIAPTEQITFVSGVTTINTITPPANFAAGGGTIIIIPTGLFSTGTSGNIAIATVAVVSRAIHFTCDSATLKWYPSY